MSLIRELIEVSIKNRDSNNLNQTLQIVFPNQMEDKELIIHEYDGSLPRLFGDNNHIELMLPEYMDTIVENAVVDAIENGTLFDDAEKVNNTAAYITMAHYPLTGMANKGLNEPHAIKHAIGSVVGAMNSEGRFGGDEVDIDNGINFAHDIVDHGNRDNVNELVGSYLDAKEANNLPVAFKKSTRKIADEVEDIKKVKPEDSITASDIDDGFSNGKTTADEVDDVETKKECGCVSGCGECGDGPSRINEDDDIPESNVDNGGDTETIDEEAEAAPGESWNKTTAGNIDEYVSEGFFNRPKKLKPIPRNVVAYITVEINAIQTTDDQQMLASYTCAKLELVDFYITCIDTKDERYIVPHTREYLVQMQNDLNRLLTRILQIRPVNRNDNRWKAILPEGRF